ARAAVAQFDASKAAEEQLSRSFQTRCVLEESVAEGATRAGARHDHPLRPRHSVLRGSAPDGGRIAPPAAASADPPVRGHLPHA
uniref:Protein phosphatase 1, regulatory subunit 35 n=2 Tax=Nannospalax galili TaxID=1026970 RepID=A0A8C6RU08_NANGA